MSAKSGGPPRFNPHTIGKIYSMADISQESKDVFEEAFRPVINRVRSDLEGICRILQIELYHLYKYEITKVLADAREDMRRRIEKKHNITL